MLGPDGFRDLARVSQFAEFLLAVAHGEGLDRPVDHALHQRGDGARIDAAARGTCPAGTSLIRRMRTVSSRRAAAFGDPGLVVALFVPTAGAGISQYWRISQLLGLSAAASGRASACGCRKQRLLAGTVAEVQIFGAARFFEARRDGGMLQQRLDLGRESEQCGRPNSNRTAFCPGGRARRTGCGVCLSQMANANMPRKRVDAIRPILLVGVDDGFGVAPGTVSMAGLFQSGTQIGVVENFAVVRRSRARRPRWTSAAGRRRHR